MITPASVYLAITTNVYICSNQPYGSSYRHLSKVHSLSQHDYIVTFVSFPLR